MESLQSFVVALLTNLQLISLNKKTSIAWASFFGTYKTQKKKTFPQLKLNKCLSKTKPSYIFWAFFNVLGLTFSSLSFLTFTFVFYKYLRILVSTVNKSSQLKISLFKVYRSSNNRHLDRWVRLFKNQPKSQLSFDQRTFIS